MRKWFIGSIVVLVALIVISRGMQAQTAPPSGAAKAIPNLSGLWGTPLDFETLPPGTELCATGGCRGLLKLPPVPRMDKNLEEPQMLPAAEEKYKAVREGVQDPNANANQIWNPSWGGCMPEGPSEPTARRGFELVQFPDAVLLLFDHDHAVRRIYLEGKHPADFKPTWMGHSIGRYDGQTLVVDTVGISDKGWIDGQGHPHTDALQVTERFRRVDEKTLEIEMTFNDPKTYAKPWTKRATHLLRPPGPNVWDSTECEELLRLGTHYSAESKK